MSSVKATEGRLDFSVQGLERPCKTWYKTFGSLSEDVRPLIVLHGGPGVPHHYLLPIADIALNYGTPVVMYDQLGCGNSTRLPEKKGAGDFWTVDLFLSELDNLLTKLGIKDDYDLLGQSWGGMLGACHAIRQPKGLHKLVIADSPASMKMWVAAADRLREQLPPDVQETLTRCEKEGLTDTEEYEKALEVYYDRHVCRIKPTPEELKRSFALLKEDMTVMLTMYSTSNGTSTGLWWLIL